MCYFLVDLSSFFIKASFTPDCIPSAWTAPSTSFNQDGLHATNCSAFGFSFSSLLASSRAPAFTTFTPGISFDSFHRLLPQSPQKWNVDFLVSGSRYPCLGVPAWSVKCSSGTMAFKLNRLPVVLWQSVQWHIPELMIFEMSILHLPHKQLADGMFDSSLKTEVCFLSLSITTR